ncbi:MAG: D-glycero-beta-D-manno-heptose-7-phosphate kinase [bacterium]
MSERLIELAKVFPSSSVLVVGDVMIDEYVWGTVDRISPEAPVPVVEFQRQTFVPGGAANVAANIVSLRGTAHIGGVVGQDRGMEILRDQLARGGVVGNLVDCPDRPTTTKTRIIGGSQQILRVDHERRSPIGKSEEDALLQWGRKELGKVDSILISDYAKGVATPRISQGFIELGRDSGKPVVVDPKGSDFTRYRGATVITPNVNDLRVGTLRFSNPDERLPDLARTLMDTLDGTSVVVTRGSDGVSLFRKAGEETDIPASVRQVFDVTGAGDTFAGALALALAAGADLEEAVRIANTAAGIVVGKVGTATVGLDELETELRSRQI